MAIIDPATEFASTDLEGALLEIIQKLQAKQTSGTDNPNGSTMVTSFIVNSLTESITVSVSIPYTPSINTDGDIVLNADQVFEPTS